MNENYLWEENTLTEYIRVLLLLCWTKFSYYPLFLIYIFHFELRYLLEEYK